MSILPDDPGMDSSSEQSGGARRLGAHRRPPRASIARLAVAGALFVCGFVWLGANVSALGIGPVSTPPPTPPIGLGPLPTGLIALQFYQPAKPAPAPCTTKLAPVFSNKVFKDHKDHLISGVDLGIDWQYLEPKSSSCQFNWTLLNQVFRQADKYKKFVVLTLKPGFGTPPWALKGVKTVTTAWSYHSVQMKPVMLPLPWDKLYLKRWFAFLGHVARRYGANPEFRMIDVGGPTSIAIEMSLPNWTGTPGTGADLDPKFPDLATTAEQYPNDSDLAMWIGEGYTPAKYTGAWTSAFKEYHELFPHQYLSLAVLNGLPIGNNHMLDQSEITETPLAVIAAGRKYGSSFVLQQDSLTSGVVAAGPPFAYVEGNCGTIVTGYQTEEPSIEKLDSADLQAGVNDGVDFIEVYESDVLDGLAGRSPSAPEADQTIEAALKTASGQLLANHGCAPLTLSATPQTATLGTQATVTAALGPASRTCPRPPGSKPLTAACPDLLANLNFHDNTYDPSTVSGLEITAPFVFTADINIYANGQLLRSCNTGTSCSMTVTPGQGLTTFTADIGAPGTIPDSSLAVVSAAAAVQRTKGTPCKPQACM
jgi:hypothetical protein